MAETNNIGWLIQRLAFTLARLNDQILQEQLGIGFSQFKILMILQWKPNVQQRTIADKLGQTEASVSRQISLLKEQGMLESIVNPENKREHITQLSAKGLKFTEKALQILNDYHAPMFDKLNAKQQAQLVESLRSLHDYICLHTDTKPIDYN